MNGSMKLTSASALLMLTMLNGCVSSTSGTAVDRLRDPAAAHAEALAGEDIPTMRATGRALLAALAVGLSQAWERIASYF